MENKKNIVDFRGPRRKTSKLSPSDKFRLFAGIRMPKLLNAMKSVRNLSNEKYYTYTSEQKKIIIKDIKDSYKEMMSAWENTGKKKIKRKSYWDRENGNS